MSLSTQATNSSNLLSRKVTEAEAKKPIVFAGPSSQEDGKRILQELHDVRDTVESGHRFVLLDDAFDNHATVWGEASQKNGHLEINGWFVTHFKRKHFLITFTDSQKTGQVLKTTSINGAELPFKKLKGVTTGLAASTLVDKGSGAIVGHPGWIDVLKFMSSAGQ